ncbi:transcriptional regulator [Schinkia azotoformans]|uniref:transcriptional regulator n=1 Tax=Schinkia azotoformans TaxID=1454 RepID=UPI002DB8B9E2|nr:transcriptional regulator [Schinkia azotoformans]MEC1725841.1 transcriptional regulator [Schinkia azotoformans]
MVVYGKGLGNWNTKFADFLRVYDYSISKFADESKVSRNTIGKLCSDHDYIPSTITQKKIMEVVRRHEPEKQVIDFWTI